MKTVLVVEDHAVNLELVKQLLEDDYEIICASDGRHGVAMALERVPDLILMDLSLPELDGWEATRQLRADPRTRATPIIALTAHAIQSELERALSAGCNGAITKPIDEDLLLAAVAAHLTKAGGT